MPPQLKGLPWLMHDWFYSTLALGVLFITSLELMFYGFYYVFFLALDPDTETSGRPGASSNAPGASNRSAGSRARTGRFAATSVPPVATTIISRGRWGSVSSQGGQYVPCATAGSDRGSTGSGGAAAAAGEETLRRSYNAEGGSWGTSEFGRPFVDANRSAATAVSSESSSSRPGVRAYQRGARYVIEGRGLGQDKTTAGAGAGAGATPAVGSAAAASVASVAGAGAAAASDGGRTCSARVPFASRLSQEEEDAAMASWAALGGGVDAGGGPGEREGSVGGSTVPRVVGPGDEETVEEIGSGDQGEEGSEEGAGGGIMPVAGSSIRAQALAAAAWMGRGEGGRDSQVHDLTDR